MTEHDLQNSIRLELSRRGCAVFRTNVGKVRLPDGRIFDTGLPKGHSDLVAYRDGMVFFVEVKVHPNKPSVEQMNFLSVMKDRYGCNGGVAYSVDDAIDIVYGGRKS